MTSWKVEMDSLRMRGALVHGWGRVRGAGASPARVWLEALGPNGEVEGKVPGVFGKQSRDAGGAVELEFILYGPLRQALPSDASCFLVLEMPGGVQVRLAAERPHEVKAAGGLAGLLSLPWKHYFVRGMQLVRYGEIGPLLRKMVRMTQSLIAAGRSVRSVLDMARRQGKPLALVIDHDLGGGANLFRNVYLNKLETDGYTPVLLTAQHGMLAYEVTVRRNGKRRMAHERDLGALFATLSSERFGCVVFNNIVSFPDPSGFVDALSALLTQGRCGRFIFLLHDYYSVCPAWLLLNHENRYCGVPDAATCDACLPRNPSPFLDFAGTRDIGVWRKTWIALLQHADEIRCFSAESKKILLKAYPGLARENVTLVPHTLDHLRLRAVKLKNDGAPVVGIIGNIGHAKGSQVVQDLARHIKISGSPVRLVVIGSADVELDRDVATVTGPYRAGQLPDLIESSGVNVGFFSSIWPETFSYVTQEMMAMGLPVLTFNLGAPMERVAAYERGLVIPLGGPAEILAGVQSLYETHVPRG